MMLVKYKIVKLDSSQKVNNKILHDFFVFLESGL